MDAEILFFMSRKDQSDFLSFATEHCDSISEDTNSSVYFFHLGSCQLLFTPSIFMENTLFTGKLEIRLSESSQASSVKDQEATKTVFRKLRKYLKKAYWSRLAYLNKNNKGKLTPSRNHWLGPDAKLWKEGDPKARILKLSQTSWMEFEIGY